MYNWGEADENELYHIVIPATTHGLGANNRLNIKVRALTSSGTDEYEDINTFLVSGTGTVTLYTDTPFSGVAVITSDTGYNITTTDHTALANRDVADQHPIGAVEGLGTALAGKLATNGDSKDCTATFTEASEKVNILSTESHATIFGKIKKWFSSLGSLAFLNSLAKADVGLANVDNLKQVATTTDQNISGNKKFTDTVCADKIRGRNLFNINGTYTKDAVTYAIDNNILTLTATSTAGTWAKKTIYLDAGNYSISCVTKNSGNGNDGIIVSFGGTNIFSKATANATPNVDKVLSGTFTAATSGIYDIAFWISFSGSLGAVGDICQFKNLQIELGSTATTYTPYIGEFFPTYDKVIRTQAEFEALIASSTWFNAKSVAFIGQFTLSTANNSGEKIPQTVKQIHGFNSAKITVTNFLHSSSTAKGGLWYDTIPTTLDYSIRDLEVDCTGNLGYGFRYCTNLTNCTGTGTGNNASSGSGFRDCTNLTNCKGTGSGAVGYGFYGITYASNCKDGGSSTAMWGGTNTNIDLDTCCKTPVTANNATLNT